MRQATIFQTKSSTWVDLVTPYDAKFIDNLKLFIPYHNRRWDPEMRSWKIRVTEMEMLMRLLKQHLFTVVVEETEEAAVNIGDNIFRLLFESIPDEYVNKVYHALAHALHPDHGGTNQQMKLLNSAYEDRSSRNK